MTRSPVQFGGVLGGVAYVERVAKGSFEDDLPELNPDEAFDSVNICP